MSSQAEILSLFNGEKPASLPVFSGLIHLTMEGLAKEGLTLHDVHLDAGKMARAALSTFKLTGMPSATLPLDLCLPAELLGAELNYEGEGFPQVRRALFESVKELTVDKERGGRQGIVCEAIRLVKEDAGQDVSISGMIPGPYTLLLYLCNPKNLFIEMKREPRAVMDALSHLSLFLAEIGDAYTRAGADLITIHDMGGSPGFIGPARYEQFAFPAEKQLIENLPRPRVLSVCGNVGRSLGWLNQAGAEAVSVDQTVDLREAHLALTDTMLFGNIDPVSVLWKGDTARVREAVRMAKAAGVDAIWPGCDLVPGTSVQNLAAMIESRLSTT